MRELVRELDGSFKKLETPGYGGAGCFATDQFDAVAAASATYVLGATAAISTAKTVTTFLHSTIATPRNLSIVCTVVGTGAGSIAVSGLDLNGEILQEAFTVPASSGAVVGKCAFATITSVVLPALTTGMTGLSCTVGTGLVLGLGSKVKVRQTAVMSYAEMKDGSVVSGGVSAGTWAAPVNGLPNGTYAPHDAPNGTAGWVVSYERDNS